LGIDHGFPDEVIGGEMHDGVRLFDRRQKFLAVEDVSDDGFETLSQKIKAGGQIVVDEDLKAGPSQHSRRMTSDVTGASYHQNLQLSPPLFSRFDRAFNLYEVNGPQFDRDRSSLLRAARL
jgi:hypothetical protein